MKMALYKLNHKDIPVAIFQIDRTDVLYAEILKDHLNHLPLPLKRIIHYKDEFVKSETDLSYLLNEDGCLLFDCWLSDREIPVNRENYSAYIKKGTTARQFMLSNYGYSFTDCYWIQDSQNNYIWNDICYLRNSVDDFVSVKDANHMYKGQNATLGGQLEKFWYKRDGALKLCKKTGKLYDVLNAREIFASEIYKRLGYKNHCDYEFLYDSTGDIVGCKCFSFVKNNLELVTAYDLLEEYNCTQQDDVYEKVIDFAYQYGLDRKECSDYMDIQTMVDYLITNRDRHQENIGFLRDAETLTIVSPAPVYDSGSCKHLEGEYPEDLENTVINGLYYTEGELLKHVKNLTLINIELLPTREQYKEILDKCNITERRKAELLSLYENKKEYLYELQKKSSLLYQDDIEKQKEEDLSLE